MKKDMFLKFNIQYIQSTVTPLLLNTEKKLYKSCTKSCINFQLLTFEAIIFDRVVGKC